MAAALGLHYWKASTHDQWQANRGRHAGYNAAKTLAVTVAELPDLVDIRILVDTAVTNRWAGPPTRAARFPA